MTSTMKDEIAARGFRDDFGFAGAISDSHGVRRVPDEGFFTGPEIGESLPGFSLVDQRGHLRDLHIDRAGSKAAVVFYRSAVW